MTVYDLTNIAYISYYCTVQHPDKIYCNENYKLFCDAMAVYNMHVLRGANIDVDDSFKIIQAVSNDNELITYLINNYSNRTKIYPKLLSGDVKNICAKVIHEQFNSIVSKI